MSAILRITDGTDSVDFVSDTFGYHVNEWNRNIASYKQAGISVNNLLNEGSQLVDVKLDNVIEVLKLKANQVDQDSMSDSEQALFRLLAKIPDYWTGVTNTP